jgi:hypothetical protein
MNKVLTVARKGMLYVFAFVLVAGYPFTAMADTQEPATDAAVQPVQASTEAPTEKKEEPKTTYTFDEENQKWNSDKWRYDPQTGTYEKPPTPVVIEPNTPAESTKSSADVEVDTDVQVDNAITSKAVSGDSTVTGNTKGGNATTGSATAVANLVNVVNSSIGTGANQKVATFTQDILGDVKGDIVLYPMLLKAMLEAEAQAHTDTTINASTNLGITNDINLAAKSGDATVEKNTTGGDATSGSASAVANVVNILNSMIAAQDSFIGTINIYGNLEGDILIAPDFIPQMLANNSSGATNADTKISTQDTTTIVNNISAVAESGAAEVFKNTNAGSATSGDADSNVVIFNVTGHEVVAKNSLLVFVNVLGKWVGMIVDAPQGATAAMIGNGVTTNTKHQPDLTIEADTTHAITNNVTVTAQSGDATVARNTNGGGAVSGQAQAMANVANVSGSQFSASDWFGVLFINVFQSWYGDFGIDTPYGNEVKETPKPSGPIQFIPKTAHATKTTNSKQSTTRLTVIDSRTTQSQGEHVEVRNVEAVLASSDSVENIRDIAKQNTQRMAPEVSSQDFRLLIIAGSVFVIGASALGLRRLLQ